MFRLSLLLGLLALTLLLAAFTQGPQPQQMQGQFHRDTWQGDYSECWLVVFADRNGKVLNWQLRCVPKGRGALT